jgi:hypothetical protein
MLELDQSIYFLSHNRAFLGREFLTWLLYCVGKNYRLGADSYCVELDAKVKLEAQSNTIKEVMVKGGNLANSAQTKEMLGQGGMVTALRLIIWKISDPTQIYSWNMESQDLWPRSVKLPNTHASDADAHKTARYEHMSVILNIIDELFKEYLSLRKDYERFAAFNIAYTNWLKE